MEWELSIFRNIAKGRPMKRCFLLVLLAATVAPISVLAQTTTQDNIIQNLAALDVGKKVCGIEPNLEYEALALKVAGMTTADLLPSGKFGPVMRRYYRQALAETDSPADIADFCETLKTTLPHMIN